MADIKSLWRSNTAIANMVRGDIQRAIELWQVEPGRLAEVAVRSELDNAPLAMTVPPRLDLLSYIGGRVAADILYSLPERTASIELLMSVSEIEHGLLKDARTAVRTILEESPHATVRPLAAYYQRMLTGEAVSAQPSSAGPQDEQPMYLDDGAIVPPGTATASSAGSADAPPPPPMAAPLDQK
jgi:hypothetical protein